MSCVARESRFTSVCLCTQVVVMITLIVLLFLAMIAYMIYARDQVQPPPTPTPFLAVLNCQIIPPISPSLTRLSSLLWRGLVLLPPAPPWSTVLYS